MSTKSGRRSSIRELKPAASKKRGRRLETKTVAEAAVATDVLEVETVEEAAPEAADRSSSDVSESTPPEPMTSHDDGVSSDAEIEVLEDAEGDAVAHDDADDEPSEPASSDGPAQALESDDDVEPTPIEAAMLAELSEGVTDNTEAFLEGLIEALLFSSDRPMPAKELARAAGIDRRRAEELVAGLKQRYESGGLTIEEVAGGYVMRSSPRYASYIQKLLALRPVRLSRAQLETLAIVAYRQPVTKPEVDDIRGVDSGQVLKGLLERELLKIVGKKDEPGRPMLYGTTTAFLELLNLQSLKDLPTLREFTELSEESRRKFADETGEAPEGVLADEAAAAGQGSVAEEVTPEAAAAAPEGDTSADHDTQVAEAAEPEADGHPEAASDSEEVATDADDAADVDDARDADDDASPVDEAHADHAAAPKRSAEPPHDDDAEEGIDLDVLADSGQLDDGETPSERG
jgi:segregation and condensation protein B